MPPGKRKRNDRGPSDAGPSRPSPHRPADTTLGQHERSFDGGRSGRGGRNSRRGERRDSSQSHPQNPPSSAGPDPRSPPLPRPSSSSSSAVPPPSSTATKPTPAPAPASAPAPPPPPPVPSFYDYSIVTEDRVERWTKGARQEVVDHGIQSREDEDLTEVAMIFQELIHSVTDARLQAADAGRVVKEMLGPELSEADRNSAVFDPHTLFLDTVSTFVDVESGPLRPQLRDFMMATEISPALMRLVLDPPILQHLDLIRDTFVRMGIRQSTNLLYRQANYNLLREETEGFSKLVTELFTTSSSEPPTSEVVQATFNKVMGLIGTFDLHPGRVLDVTFDVYAAVLIKQFRFFVKFLRVSSWWPRSQLHQPANNTFVGGLPIWALPNHSGWSTTDDEEIMLAKQRLQRDVAFWERAREIKLDAYFELGGGQLTAAEEERLANGAESSVERDWIRLTKTRPPPGNRDAAQMLGFKLRFYTSEARDAEDTLPANLLYLISLLIKIGFVSITDIWNHIWPRDEDMENVRTQMAKELEEKEKSSRPGGEKNALMMAGALPDDMPPPPTNASRRDALPAKPDLNGKAQAPLAEEKPKLPEPSDQKLLLLKCLLTIGAIPESLFIIGRHEWTLDAYPEILPLLHRILHHSVELVYQQSCPTSSRPTECPPKKQLDPDQSSVPKGSIKLNTPPVKRALRWPHPDKADAGDGASYRFYWDEWADNIPVCQNVDDLFTLCDSLLNVVGVNIGLDASLVAKFASIGCKSLADDPSPDNFARWLALLKRILVPALSLGDPNSSIVDSVWTLLKQYPIRTRFNVYAEWHEGATSRLEPMRKAFARTRLETLSKMKRLSHSNILQMAKSLAKIAYASPGVVCKVALQQIESYSNLIEAFVECAKYFTDLGYDVLVWSVLSSLGGQQRSRTQETSVLLTSKWLQALSRFSGKVFERYSNMDPSPILRYVHSQLLQGNSTDLVILEELIESMGGIVSGFDFTDAQLRGMTGGELLRRETLTNLGDKRAVSVRTAQRLMKALSQSNLAGQLLINIAQYRQNAIFAVADDSARIKYLSNLVDGAHNVLCRYLDLLISNLEPEAFDALIPDVVQLMRDYGIDANLAFMIWRRNIRWDTKAPAPTRDSSQPAKAATDIDGDVTMEPAAENGTPAQGDAKADSKKPTPRLPESLPEALAPLIDEISSVLPQQSWEHITPACYVFFWSLQLGNLVWPQNNYDAESKRLQAQAEEVKIDRSDTPRSATKKRQKRDEIMARQQRLVQETKDGIERFSKTKLHIGRQVGTWFPAGVAKADAAADALLEECILPRLQVSPVDAEYCFRLIKFLHQFSTPNFKLMSLYDRLFNHNRLRALIFTCTVREAEYLARFLKFILGDLSRWHGNKSAYEKEALGLKELQGTKTREYLGFATKFDADGKPTEFIEHDAFKELLFRWHKELNTALRSCLNGMEWMHIRNAITVLKGIIDFFPAINFMADKFLEQLKTITDRESASSNAPESAQGHRVDLSVTAQTTYSELQRRKSKWVLVQAFRPGIKTDSKDERASAAPANSSLRGSAASFRPNSARPSRPSEVEDGEVDETRAGNIPSKPTTNGPNLSRGPPPTKEPPRQVLTPAQRAVPTPPNSGRSVTPKSLPTPPHPHPAHPANRQEPPRFSTLPPGGPGLPSRPDLPNRPDINGPRFGQPRHERRDLPSRDLPSRDAREYRDGREPRDQHQRDPREPHGPREGRDFRAPEAPRPERPPPSDRRAPEAGPRETGPRDAGRDAGRDVGRDSGRDAGRDVGRDTARENARDAGRDAGRPSDRGRPEVTPRRHDHTPLADRESRPDSRPPPRERGAPQPSGRSDSRAPRETAVATPPPGPAAQGNMQGPPMNPERAALIQDTREPPSRPSPRDQPRERPSRAESPRRSDRPPPSAHQPDNTRDDRQGRHHPSPRPEPPRDSHGDTPTPNARPERMPERMQERDDRKPGPRDSHSNQPRPDQDQGRLNQQDPNYGRLNAIQSVVDMPTGAPSGPRGRGGRNAPRSGPVNGPPMPMRSDNRFPALEPIRPPTPERHPPTGPSASRPRRGPYEGGNMNSPTSGAPPPMGGHPDRGRNMHPGPPPPPPPPPPPTGPSGIHPDRLNQIAPQQMGPGPHSHSRPPPMHNTPDRPPMPAPNSGSRGAPSGPSADFSSTPTGPAASERMRPGGRQLRGIQNMLDKASADNARGPSLRMSRSRPSLAGSDAQILAGASPVTTPVHERPPESPRDAARRPMPTERAPRPEPIQVVSDSRESSSRGPANGEDHGSSRNEHERSRREHHRSERGTRSSGRTSRDRTPDRDRESKDSREYRDRRSGVSSAVSGSGARDERDSRRSMRESTGGGGGRESMGGGARDMAPPRESSSHRSSHRGDGPPGSRSEGPPGGGRSEGGHGGRSEGGQGGRSGEDYGRSGSSRGNGPPRESRSSRPDERGESRGGDDRTRKRRSEGAELGGSGSHQDKRQRR